MVKPVWIKGGVRIPLAVIRRVEEAAVNAYGRDEEACGYLAGPDAEPLLVTEAVELENLANKYHAADPEAHPRTGREYFKINALKFERAVEARKVEALPIKVFFHSHLDCGAYFSQEDAASMTQGGKADPAFDLCYLVTAVDAGKVTAHRLFAYNFETKTFDEAPFHLEES